MIERDCTESKVLLSVIVKSFSRYTNIEKERILQDAGLTVDEEAVFLMLKRGDKTIAGVALSLHFSVSKVNCLIHKIKLKIEEI